MKEVRRKECACGQQERWAADPTFPVRFDQRTGEWQLVHGRMVFLMKYCYWCGGRLPDSKRDSLFTTPSEAEIAEVNSLMAGAKSIEDVLRILWPADEIHKWADNLPTDPNTVRWEKMFRYSARWDTLSLNVLELEMPDGSIAYAISGLFIG